MALRPPHFRVFPVYSGLITIEDLDYTGRFPQTSPPDSHAPPTHDIMQDFKAATVHLLERFAQDAALSARKHQSWAPIAGLVEETEP
ncbi:hypothetical protein BC826DRAFT_1101602 [Russula brevipes]|nr:hypothetical protein BC826DRAFT_1101602 [Russula brevipes]